LTRRPANLDIERLPSGKFATNALVLACAQLAYKLLRWLGQVGLLGARLSMQDLPPTPAPRVTPRPATGGPSRLKPPGLLRCVETHSSGRDRVVWLLRSTAD
jgi:hypothetical protein